MQESHKPNKSDFKDGELVKLKSGGPKMVVWINHKNDTSQVNTTWFNKHDIQIFGMFEPQHLVKVDG